MRSEKTWQTCCRGSELTGIGLVTGMVKTGMARTSAKQLHLILRASNYSMIHACKTSLELLEIHLCERFSFSKPQRLQIIWLISHLNASSFVTSCCCRDDDDKVVFKGWARMALPIEQFSIIEVRKPNVGENKPAGVEADVVIDLKGAKYEPQKQQCPKPHYRMSLLSHSCSIYAYSHKELGEELTWSISLQSLHSGAS